MKTYAIFSATRLFVYAIFGISAGLAGEWVLHRFFESFLLSIIFCIFGIFLLFLGLALIIEKAAVLKKCHNFIHRYIRPESAKNTVIFGLVVSFSPCMPLLAVLGYIVLLSDTWGKGAAYMTVFGFGTIISPMIILAFSAGWAGGILNKNNNLMKAARIVCGLIICFLGINLFLVGLRGVAL